MTSSHANHQVPVPRTPDSQAPPARRTAGGQTSKLRDSCHACALSKVRCHKEKPACSRCTRRGITCEYFVTKRPGRKRDTSHNVDKHGNGDSDEFVRRVIPAAQEDLWPGNTSSTVQGLVSAGNSYLTPLELSPTSPRPGNGCFSSDIFMMPLDSSLSSALAGMSNDLDAFFTSPIDFSELEPPDNNFTQGHEDIAKLLMPGDSIPDPASETSSLNHTNASSPSSPSLNSQALSTSDASVSGALDSTCGCLIRTLDCMKKVCSTTSPTSTLPHVGHINNPSAHTIVMENKQTIEIVSNILQCPCAEDGCLPTILSIVIFKILERYAGAARKQPGGVLEGDEKLSDEGLERMAAQMVLSELHRVQRLVNQLSPRLKIRATGEAGKGGGTREEVRNAGGDHLFPSLLDGKAVTTAFSATTLDQIEIDLRKRLSNLSSEIINMLRQS